MNQEEIKMALDEYSSCVGMISEVRAKLLLLKNKTRLAVDSGCLTLDMIQETERCLIRIKSDLSRYTNRLRIIHKEFLDHGIIS